jgi:hypothetical protein
MSRIISAGIIFIMLQIVASTGLAEMKIKSLCGIHYPSDDSIQWQCLKLKWTDTPNGLFDGHWQDVLRFNRMDRRHFFGGISIKVPKHLEDIKNFTPLPKSYPEAEKEAKFILVDQTEMFLGAYEHGKLVFSSPVAVGTERHPVPNGTFRIDAADRDHISNLYTVEEIERPYPMHYALRFFTDKSVESETSYFIHGRDLPGYPASHGCIGLYDEEMQQEYYSAYDKKVNKPYYHELTKPYLEAAKTLYQWVIDPASDPGSYHAVKNGPRVLIIGSAPLAK